MREIASEIDRQIYIEKQRDKTDRKDRQREREREGWREREREGEGGITYSIQP